jgi:hypothetical protein
MSTIAISLPATKADNSRHRQLVWAIAIFLLLALSATIAILLKTHFQSSGASITPAAYRKQLEAEVETSTGAPINGRNPANQLQTSLAKAASMEDDIGMRVAKPAASVIGTVRHTDPATVLPNTKVTHVLASGCLLGYGVPGAQCVPAKAPNNQLLNCNFIRTIFPNGVKILGTDYLSLGQGTDIACAANNAAPKG